MNTRLILTALVRHLGEPRDGDLVFTRCLTREDISEVLADQTTTFRGWQLFGVGAAGLGWIAADAAVEIRENKGRAAALLVDVSTAGAGMDGIYSAAREIKEEQLFGESVKLAERELDRDTREFARDAVRRARRVRGSRQSVAPRQEFEFYAALVDAPTMAGSAVARLGLWPVAGAMEQAKRLLPQAGLMVEKLLLPPATAQAPALRVAGLVLDEQDAQRSALEGLLRQAGSMPLLDALMQAAGDETLWLGNLRPAFLTNKLVGIDLVSWRRQQQGGISRWSGLTQASDDELPQFAIDTDNPRCRLEVRWRVRPEHLPKGAASFEVRVLAGEEVLASRQMEHNGKSELKAVFTAEDFDELEDSVRLEACVEVAAPSNADVEPQQTEDFVVLFGETKASDRVSSGDVFRAVAEGIVQAETREEVEELVEQRQQGKQGQPDKHGFLAFRVGRSRRGFRVERPPLLKAVEDDWERHTDAPVGRWRVQCRPDGSWSGGVQYEPLPRHECPEAEWTRLVDVARRFRDDCQRAGGVLSRLYLHGHSSANVAADYLNAWQAVLERGPAVLGLANTIEVQTLAGRTLGLIVLPFHAQRVAWQSAYDTLALHLKLEANVPVKRLRTALGWLDSAHFPFALPGFREGETFVFADVLGLAGVLMVPVSDREPKSAAALMATCYAGNSERLVLGISTGSGEALAREITHYLDSHGDCRFLHVHALRPGDGATVVRALGTALKRAPDEEEAEQLEAPALRDVAVRLELHPTEAQSAVAGRHLIRLNQRRRAGTAAPPPEDAWSLESLPLGGERSVPRLRWARREPGGPTTPAHLAIAFDTFHSQVVAVPRPADKLPLLAFGLIAHLRREFRFENGRPCWRLNAAPEHEGEKLSERIVTDRLLRMHTALLDATARSAGVVGGWPVLVTEPSADDMDVIERLHRLCDWVVMVDRNAGVEYFDSPREAEHVFDAYVIDAVPERDDIGCLQLITSTAHFDEVRRLLDDTLTLMGLSSSARNCVLLLNQLKALSGRLAMRLAAGSGDSFAGHTSAELVALALARKKCLGAADGDPCWPSLRRGFFIPLDEVRDLIPESPEPKEEAPADRAGADLVHVFIPARGRLGLRFVEVKYRRHLSLARSSGLAEGIARQTAATRDRWLQWFFSDDAPPAERTLRATRLARVLRFYADKALRHHLNADTHRRFAEEIDRFLAAPSEYELGSATPDRGLVFCPDFTETNAERLAVEDDCEIWLFGPDTLPDRPVNAYGSGGGDSSPEPATAAGAPVQAAPRVDSETAAVPSQSSSAASPPAEATASQGEAPVVLLGTSTAGEDIGWTPSLRGNPHLMIVGLPGMGKTTCLTNICRQLQRRGVTPIVFSYHDDIDEQLAADSGTVIRHDCRHLGFNPMRVTQPGPLAHIESAGQLRYIFQAVFPDLGELQLEQLRAAIKQSYEETGWGGTGEADTPPFHRFLDVLRDRGGTDKRTQTLLARLNELDDFRFFAGEEGEASLLEGEQPRLVCIHAVSNDAVQRAYASFVLYRIYQDMFRRGRQERITHAVIFDEAHRASRLRLLPTMAKECRKYGLALIVASQEARDFDPGLFAAIANYLVLRVTDLDARAMARNVASSDIERRVVDKLKSLPKFEALFFAEERRRPVQIRLCD